MTWFKIDDGFADHPKVDALLNGKMAAGAIALWTLAGVWCGKQLTDGVVPPGRVRRLGLPNGEALAAELVRVGLWVATEDGGFRFHQWSEHQPTREQVHSERARKAKNQKDARDRQRAEKQAQSSASPVQSPVTHRCETGESPRPDPTRPDPSEISGGEISGSQVATSPPVTPPQPLTTTIDLRWRRDFETHRGIPSGGAGDAETRKLAQWLEAHERSSGMPAREAHDAIATAYWADPWTRDRTRGGRPPSMANLLTQLDRLAAEALRAAPTVALADYDPSMPPTTPAQEAMQRAWIKTGLRRAS